VNTESYELGIQYEYGLDIHRIGTLLARTFVFVRYKITREYGKCIIIGANTENIVLIYEILVFTSIIIRENTNYVFFYKEFRYRLRTICIHTYYYSRKY